MDGHHISRIKDIIDRPGIFIFGTDIKILMTMGDRLAGSLWTIIGEMNPITADIAQKVDVLVRQAFSTPTAIACEYDKVPTLSLYLLRLFIRRTPEPTSHRLLEALESWLGDIYSQQQSLGDSAKSRDV